jgi:hypothetical protein
LTSVSYCTIVVTMIRVVTTVVVASGPVPAVAFGPQFEESRLACAGQMLR